MNNSSDFRLCSLHMTRLTLCKPLGSDVATVMIAVKLQSSKRTLRSNEITVPVIGDSGTGTVQLDLTFSLQYTHFLKRSGNQLQIMIQRRKRYKHRAILGFKTLAFGVINMAEVLQRSTNSEELELIANTKELGKNATIARILISSLKSQPIDQECNPNSHRVRVPLDSSADVDSDDEDFSSGEEGSDSEEPSPSAGAHNTTLSTRERVNEWRRQVNRKNRMLFAARHTVGSDTSAQRNDRNLKQKFISLLKKFRLPDSEAFDSEEQYQAAIEQQLMASGELQNSKDIDEFFEEEDIDDLSDSEHDFDDISITSTPKPSLKPFFSSCTLIEPEPEPEVLNGDFKKRIECDSQENSGPEQTADRSDMSLKTEHKSSNSKKISKKWFKI
ncbi:phosphofurin acidic cluster sorting protein 1-like [Oppia nitens]|uniref:phosphofurin acidic cluster sorting protein 1-like n=1 Tax=Oppia nitens TaxID=1686743 RepID=UPI0023DBADCA|nr:phosphofurin acidic cluster sorting protein 1-like [Oppia nitens]